MRIPVDTDAYRIVRRLEPAAADCDALRPLEAHLLALARLLEDHGAPSGTDDDDQAGVDWRRTREWLRRAGGLHGVVIELRADEPSPWMCGHVVDALEAEDALAGQQATEQTRLMYANAALERLLASLRLPQSGRRRGDLARAQALLASEPRDPLDHQECVLRHLLKHLRGEPGLAGDHRLGKALEPQPWRTREGLLLSAGHALRNFPAHGDADLPLADGDYWELRSAARDDVGVHAERLATRALALGMQHVLLAALSQDPPASVDPHGAGFAERAARLHVVDFGFDDGLDDDDGPAADA